MNVSSNTAAQQGGRKPQATGPVAYALNWCWLALPVLAIDPVLRIHHPSFPSGGWLSRSNRLNCATSPWFSTGWLPSAICCCGFGSPTPYGFLGSPTGGLGTGAGLGNGQLSVEENLPPVW